MNSNPKSKRKAKAEPTGYWVRYACGCTSATRRRASSLARRCPEHNAPGTLHYEFGAPGFMFSV